MSYINKPKRYRCSEIDAGRFMATIKSYPDGNGSVVFFGKDRYDDDDNPNGKESLSLTWDVSAEKILERYGASISANYNPIKITELIEFFNEIVSELKKIGSDNLPVKDLNDAPVK